MVTRNPSPIEILQQCGGYYCCPKNKYGERLGPLVELPGIYKTPDGEIKHFVSDVYYNLAIIEQYPCIFINYAAKIAEKLADTEAINLFDKPNATFGIPMNGIIFAHSLAIRLKCKIIFCEKKITQVATTENSEKSIFVLERHKHGVSINDRIIVVLDTYNLSLLSIIDETTNIIRKLSAEVVVIVCILNTSSQTVYETKLGVKIPIISLINKPLERYRQDDPRVAKDIDKGNLILNPENNWFKLKEVMKIYEKSTEK